MYPPILLYIIQLLSKVVIVKSLNTFILGSVTWTIKMDYGMGHPLYHGAWHQPPVDEATAARYRALQQAQGRSESTHGRSESTQGLNLATWHDAARYEASRMDASKLHRQDVQRQLELERQELERRFEMPEQKYIPEHKFVPPTETDVRLENEMDFLFSPENPEKQQQGSKHAQGPSEVIESTPDIPVPHWESENEESDIEWRNGPPKPSFIEETEIKKEPTALKEEKGNANAIDPINEAPRIEKWFRINPNAPKSMIDHYTFQLNEGRCKRYDKMRKENPDEAVPFPKLEAKDLNAWFIQRRGGSNGDDDQIPYGSSK